jgi:uncharacterized protein YndB with AHSA1/START domain
MSASRYNRSPGQLTDASTLVIQRRLPGTPERVWAYLTDSDLRRQWLASGDMPAGKGAGFELTWRNDELSASAGERPDGFSAESRGSCEMLEFDPPRRLRYLWSGVGEVLMELAPVGNEVLLTLTHSKLLGERLVLNVCAGWDSHLALLVALVEGTPRPSLWNTWKERRAEYEVQLRAS